MSKLLGLLVKSFRTTIDAFCTFNTTGQKKKNSWHKTRIIDDEMAVKISRHIVTEVLDMLVVAAGWSEGVLLQWRIIIIFFAEFYTMLYDATIIISLLKPQRQIAKPLSEAKSERF